MVAIVAGELNDALPEGYHARPFEDADREPIVAMSNAEAHPMETETAEEWRRWATLLPDATRVRVTVVGGTGAVVATGTIGAGLMASADGAQNLAVSVHPDHRRRGIGSALLSAFEGEALRRKVPIVRSGASAARPFALAFATKRGYREIGRRILSYRELGSFDPARWQAPLDRVAAQGIVFRSFSEILADRDEAEQEAFWHDLWVAEGPMWDDIPFATPTPHWPYERFRTLNVENPQILRDLSLVAYHGTTIVGYTMTGDRQGKDGTTYMTGVAREHRGKGIAMALKVAALSRAKATGLRAMLTVNDEPNRAMRGVNIKLGYEPVPAHVELEKSLA